MAIITTTVTITYFVPDEGSGDEEGFYQEDPVYGGLPGIIKVEQDGVDITKTMEDDISARSTEKMWSLVPEKYNGHPFDLAVNWWLE